MDELEALEQEIRDNYPTNKNFSISCIDLIDHTLQRKPQFAVKKDGKIIALSLEKMGLEKIPEAIRDMRHLQSLNLGENRIDVLPEWLPELPLTHLYLHYNQIPGDLSDHLAIPALITLDLAGNKITRLDLSSCRSLRFLYLHTNTLSTTPSLPPSLLYLNISNNQLAQFPELDLPDLIDLKLDGNQLTIIPNTISSLSSLQELHCRNNQIQSISDHIGKLPDLQVLNLRENQLHTLPSSLQDIKILRSLDLRANLFQEIPPSLLDMRNIKIDLRWNKLENRSYSHLYDSLVLYY